MNSGRKGWFKPVAWFEPWNGQLLTWARFCASTAIATSMFPVVLWNIFAMTIANPFFADFCIVYFIVLRHFAALCFSIVFWNISAFLHFIVLVNITAAFLFARNALFHTTLCCVIARLVSNTLAPAFNCFTTWSFLGHALFDHLA